jgi:hypothetical protein
MNTVPIQHQGDDRTCFAHAIARCACRLLRIVGVADESHYHAILNWAVLKYGSKGANTERVLRDLIKSETNDFIPATLRPFLFVDKLLPADIDQVKDALAQKRHVIIDIRMQQHQMRVLSPYQHEEINSTHILPYDKTGVSSGHSMILFAVEGRTLHIKNSWGKDYGRNGKLSINLDICDIPGVKMFFLDLRFSPDCNCPQQYITAARNFDYDVVLDEINLHPLPLLSASDIKVDHDNVLGKCGQ